MVSAGSNDGAFSWEAENNMINVNEYRKVKMGRIWDLKDQFDLELAGRSIGQCVLRQDIREGNVKTLPTLSHRVTKKAPKMFFQPLYILENIIKGCGPVCQAAIWPHMILTSHLNH